MYRPFFVLPALVATLSVAVVPAARAQDSDNRGRYQPGLIIETGGRNGACDVLTFTPDGRTLMAVGDDKVVRMWPLEGDRLDTDNARVLRWSIWRERRGSIYALAFDPKHDRVAVGGLGDTNGRVSVLDRAEGQVLYTIPAKEGDNYANGAAIWSMAFSPSGNLVAFGADDGAVWVWDLTSAGQQEVRRVGVHALANGDSHGVNRVRWVAFDGEDRLLSAAQDGSVLAWSAHKSDQQPERILHFRLVKTLTAVVASRDGKWLAAAGVPAGADNQVLPTVELRSLDGRESKQIDLPARHFVRCLAFDPRGDRLAVGAWVVPEGATFQKFVDGPVFVCDLAAAAPHAERVLDTTYYPEALAFDPKDPSRLAVAGGADQEVALWRLGRGKAIRLSEVPGKGKGLWSVGLDETNSYKLGIRSEHVADPASPNRRGDGDWRVFDLVTHKWSDPKEVKDFKPVEPLETAGGWTVRFDATDSYRWYAVASSGKKWPLPWNSAADDMPRCYTFLEPTADGANVRLAVGHYWGISVFDLDPKDGPRRVRVFSGHQAEVTALAPSADSKLLVSASRDQTVAAWSLADWASQPELGAKFSLADGKLMVDQVDTGSPAWEAGLHAGDEIVQFSFGSYEFLFEKDPALTKIKDVARYKKTGSAKDALARLLQPVPEQWHIFGVLRGGKLLAGAHDGLMTTVRQRPLWRFLPLFEQPDQPPEWVLWLWQDYYYDTSTRGDFYIGWQVNGKDGTTPTFYRAEQFRKRFNDPDRVAKAIRTGVNDPERPSLIAVEPPKITLDAPAQLAGPVVPVGLAVEPHGAAPEQQASRVVVWVNNYAAYTWTSDQGPLPKHVDLPRGVFRTGHNEILAQAFNSDFDEKHLGRGRSESESKTITNGEKAAPAGTLYLVAVGVQDYSKVRRNGVVIGGADLQFPVDDAEAIAQLWSERKGGRLFQDVRIVPLENDKATRDNIRGEMKKVADEAGPDDSFILFISGHGSAKQAEGGTPQPGTYAFCTCDFDLEKPETGLSGDDLAEDLGRIKCRKLVLLDTCHSGGAAPEGPDGVRDLTPNRVGPLVLAACGLSEEAQEAVEVHHGLFTRAFIDAAKKRFDEADRNGDGVLDADELADEVIKQVPLLCQKYNQKLHHPVLQSMQEDRTSLWVEKK